MVASYGAEKAFNYRSQTCVSDIQAYTNNSITHVLDCVSTPSSMALCYKILKRSFGDGVTRPKYTALEPYSSRISASRPDIIADWVLLLTQFGESVMLSGVYEREPRPQDRVWMQKWYELVQRLVWEKKLRTHRVELLDDGGLNSIASGLDRLKSSDISGTKLVCRLAWT